MHNLPATASDDVIVHPRDQDLVLATHGRRFFVLDVDRSARLTGDLLDPPRGEWTHVLD